MTGILRGGPLDGRRVQCAFNVFGTGELTHVIDQKTGKTVSCRELYYESDGTREKDPTRPRAMLRVFRFKEERDVDPKRLPDGRRSRAAKLSKAGAA